MFDPYHKWLGIPKDQRPPTHYQLLGVSPDEQDLEVIDEAAIRQTTHVRAYQMGAHAADCTRVLNEIAKARLTLLNAAKRKEYDEQLAKTAKPPAKPETAPVQEEVTEIAPLEVAEKVKVDRRPETDDDEAFASIKIDRKSKRAAKDAVAGKQAAAGIGLLIGLGVGAGAFGLLLVFAIGAFFILKRGPAQPKNDGVVIAQDDGKDRKKLDGNNPVKDKNKGGKDGGKDKKPIDPPIVDPGKDPKIVIPAVVAPEFNPGPPSVVLQLGVGIDRACLSADGRRLAISFPQKGVIRYRQGPDFKGPEIQATVEGAESIVEPLASSLDSTKMALAGLDKQGPKIFVWNWNTMRVENAFKTMHRAHAAYFSPDGNYLAAHSVAMQGTQAKHWFDVYRVKTGEHQTRLTPGGERPFVAFMPDSNTIFAAPFGPEAMVNSWIMPGNVPGNIQFPQPSVAHFFSPDFTRYAYIANPRQLKVGFTAGVRETATIGTDNENTHIHTAAFSPDNRYLVLGLQDVSKLPQELGSFSLIDTKDGKTISSLPLQSLAKHIQLAANGLCLVHEAKRPPVLWRFNTAGDAPIAKVDPPQPPNNAPFVPLFNGKDLTGWQANPAQPSEWQVVDGILSAKSAEGFLYTTRSDFNNFHLRAELRRKAGGSGGVKFRYSLDFQGYEVGFSDKPAGRLDLRTKTPGEENSRTLKPLSRRVAQPADEWYTLEILAEGNQTQVLINGKLVANALDSQSSFATGRIGLRDFKQSVEFRKIEIKELGALARAPGAKPIELASINGQATYEGSLGQTDLLDGPKVQKLFHFVMLAGRTYEINLKTKGLRALLFLEEPNRKPLPLVDEAGSNLEKKITHQATKSGRYRIVVMSDNGTFGEFSLSIRQTTGAVAKNDVALKPGDGKFISRNSGKILGVFAGATNDGAPIVQWQETPGALNQHWRFVPVDKEWFNIVNVGSGTCMTVQKNTNKASSTRLAIWQKKDGDPAQEWKAIPADPNDAALIKLVNRTDGRILSVVVATDKDGAPAVVKVDAGGPEQIWKIDGFNLANLVPVKKTADPAPTVRAALPDPDKIAEAEKAIREQFKKEYAKKSAPEMAALAEKLLQFAKDTNDDPTSRYVLLRDARDLATKSGRPELAMKVAAELTEKYDVEDLATRVDTLSAFSKYPLNPEATKQFVEIAIQQAANAQLDDHFTEALKMLKSAETILNRSKNAVLLTQVQKLEKQFGDIAKEHVEVVKAQEKLAADPKDASANLLVGAFLTFRRGNWEKGLPLLALSGNAELQDLAKKDAAAGDDEKLRIEAGHAWWKAAEKKPPHQLAAMQWRAGHWYRLALPNLTGLKENEVTARLKLLDAAPPPFRIAGGISEVDRYKGHIGPVTWLVLAPDGKRVYSSGMDGTVRVWNFTTGKASGVLGPQFTKGSVTSFAVTPDERTIAFMNKESKFSCIEIATMTPPKFGKGEGRDAVPGFFWNSDTSISYASKRDWHTWDPTKGSGSGGPLILNSATQATPRAVVMSPEIDFGAVLCFEKVVATFRTNGGRGRFAAPVIDFNATTAAFSKDAKLLVLGARNGNLGLFPTGVMNPKEVVALKGHTAAVRCATFSPDGKQIITGGDDRMLRVWDVRTGKELQQFPHQGAVASVVATPDNRYVISASADAIVRMWRLPTDKSSSR